MKPTIGNLVELKKSCSDVQQNIEHGDVQFDDLFQSNIKDIFDKEDEKGKSGL